MDVFRIDRHYEGLVQLMRDPARCDFTVPLQLASTVRDRPPIGVSRIGHRIRHQRGGIEGDPPLVEQDVEELVVAWQ